MRTILLTFILLVLYIGCSNNSNKPGNEVIVIVSSDTLSEQNVETMYNNLCENSNDSTKCINFKDSINNEIIQNWINRKLILRQARNDRFKYKFPNTKFDSQEKEIYMIKQYLNQVKKENNVTKWEVKQYIKEMETDKKLNFKTARQRLQKQKLNNWIISLRKKGGYIIKDKSILNSIKSYKTNNANDTSSDAISSILDKIFPYINSPSSISIITEITKQDIDSTFLKDLNNKLKTTKMKKKKKNVAHLYRKPQNVLNTINSHLYEVKEIFQKAAKRNSSINGRVTVRISILETGLVSRTQVLESEISDTLFIKNLLSKIKNWEFKKIPENSGIMSVNYPFDFSVEN